MFNLKPTENSASTNVNRRKAINILRKFVHQVGSVYKDYTRMYSQQNIK